MLGKVCGACPKAAGQGPRLCYVKAGADVEGLLPRAEAGLGEGLWRLWRLQGGKRHHKLGVNLLFWRDKGSTSHWRPDMWPHPNAGTQKE